VGSGIDLAIAASGLTHVLVTRPEEEPVYVLDRRSGRLLDRLAEEEFGIPTLLLMENAAVWIAAYASSVARGSAGRSALIVAGKGNNGGDGLAAARHLLARGWNIGIVLGAAEAAYSGDAAVNLGICRRLGLRMVSAAENGSEQSLARVMEMIGTPTLLVDALFGTGLSGALSETTAGLIHGINRVHASGVTVLSVDIPSGLDADSGLPSPVAAESSQSGNDEPLAVRADVTVSLVGMKPGFLELAAQEYVGEVLIADIGVPRDLVKRLGKRLESSERAGRRAEPTRTVRLPLPYRPGESEQASR